MVQEDLTLIIMILLEINQRVFFKFNIKKFDEIEEIKFLYENGLIKIDTEGFEYEVLEGAKSFIKHNKPI